MLLIATVIDRHNLSDGLSRPRNPEWLQLRPNAVIDLEIRPDDEVITGLSPKSFQTRGNQCPCWPDWSVLASSSRALYNGVPVSSAARTRGRTASRV